MFQTHSFWELVQSRGPETVSETGWELCWFKPTTNSNCIFPSGQFQSDKTIAESQHMAIRQEGKTMLKKTFILIIVLSAVMMGTHMAYAVDFECTPVELLEKTDFTHVECADGIGLGGTTIIRYFAIRHTDLNKLKRFQDLAARALSCGGLVFRVSFPRSGAGNVGGCLEHDCREVSSFGIRRQ
jgi:hypothetical protein